MPDETTKSTELLRQLRDENEYLRQELDVREQEASVLQKELAESRERSDTIILQLTRQLEQSQRLLEYNQAPWWRKWLRKNQKTAK